MGVPAVLAAVACGLTVAPALALTEARIIDVSCHGLRIVQEGLPVDTELTVEAIDAADGHVLVERDVRSSSRGRVDVTFRVSLRGVHRLHGEVVAEDGAREEEYGEADVSLDDQCRVIGTEPVPVTSAAPRPAAAPASDDGIDTWVWVVGIAAAAALAGGAGMARARRRTTDPS